MLYVISDDRRQMIPVVTDATPDAVATEAAARRLASRRGDTDRATGGSHRDRAYERHQARQPGHHMLCRPRQGATGLWSGETHGGETRRRAGPEATGPPPATSGQTSERAPVLGDEPYRLRSVHAC